MSVRIQINIHIALYFILTLTLIYKLVEQYIRPLPLFFLNLCLFSCYYTDHLFLPYTSFPMSYPCLYSSNALSRFPNEDLVQPVIFLVEVRTRLVF